MMEIDGLDYNTQREKLKLMAYGRNIQQMVETCVALPTKAERQRCAQYIIDVMKRAVPSQAENRDRVKTLWYHLALMSDFKLDIDYPVEIIHEDKMAIPPEKIPYAKKGSGNRARHYGKLMFDMLDALKNMPAGKERDTLANLTAMQMYQCLASWGMGTVDKEKVASDMAKYTDGVIQLDVNTLNFDAVTRNRGAYSQNERSRGQDYQNRRKKKKRK